MEYSSGQDEEETILEQPKDPYGNIEEGILLGEASSENVTTSTSTSSSTCEKVNTKKNDGVAGFSGTSTSTCVNAVDHLIKLNFLSLPLEEQLEIVKLGPHQPRNVQIHQTDETQNRYFSDKWFDKIEWLTVSETSKIFYCFYCLLVGGESIWCKGGYNSIKHLSKNVKLHENTSNHINNVLKFKTLGFKSISPIANTDLAVLNNHHKHNEDVYKNRHFLDRILDCLKFCATHELPKPDDKRNCIFNGKIFLELVLEVATRLDTALQEYIIKYTAESIQNELLDSMLDVYLEDLKADIEKCNFLSVHVEKIPDVSKKSHFAITVRFMKNFEPVERLYGLMEVDPTRSSLAECIKNQLGPLEVRGKVIAQTFDGTVAARGPYGGIQNCLKDFFPHALFIHSYHHSFETIIRQASSNIPSIRMFFTNLFKFRQFFLKPSKELLELFQLHAVQNNCCWKSEFEIIKNVYENQIKILQCCGIIKNGDGWDSDIVYKCLNLIELLEDAEFRFFVSFFYIIFHHLEVLNQSFKQRNSCGDVMSVLEDFERKMVNMMESPELEYKTVVTEVSGIVITEIRERLEATDHLVAFSVLHLGQLRARPKFPHDHVQVLACKYRMLSQSKLINELKVLYSNSVFATVDNQHELLNLITENDLRGTFTEIYKLSEIMMALPVEPANIENWVSVSDRLQNFLKPYMGVEKLDILTILMVHKDVIESTPEFNRRVIEKFASKGVGKPDLLYVP